MKKVYTDNLINKAVIVSSRILISSLINFGGKKKQLYCKYCNRITEHVSISRSDAHKKYYGEGKSSGFLDTLSDMLPTSNLVEGIPFMCKECSNIRSSGCIFGDDLYFVPLR